MTTLCSSGLLTRKRQRRDPATEQSACPWCSCEARACDPGASEGQAGTLVAGAFY